MPKRTADKLVGERRAKGYEVAKTYEVPSNAQQLNNIESWRSAFAAGWAARDARDDEPAEDGTTVWLIDTSGGRWIGHRNDSAANGDARWLVTGGESNLPITWREVLEDVADWGLLTEVTYT